MAVGYEASPYLTIYKTTLNATTLISPALNVVPSKYHDLGYAKESGVKEDVLEQLIKNLEDKNIPFEIENLEN